jgi:hypothetical protein
MSFFKKVLPIIVGFLLIGSAAYAQKNKQSTPKKVSNKELKEFGQAFAAMQKINMKTKPKAEKMIQQSGLTKQRYVRIRMSKMNSKGADTLHVSKKEQKEYQKLQPKLSKLQHKAQAELMASVKKQGLTFQRFQQIAMQIRQSKDLQQRFQKMRMKEMKSGKGNSH